MYFPHPVLHNRRFSSNNETVKLFTFEMRKIVFSVHAAGCVHSVPKSHILKDLSTVQKLWLRLDRFSRSLEASLCGPFEVISRHHKYFVLKLPQGDTSVYIADVDSRPELGDQAPVRNDVSVASESSSELSEQLPENLTSTLAYFALRAYCKI